MDDLPEFQPKKFYLVRGATGNVLVNALQTHRACCVTGGGLSIDSQGLQGIFLRGTAAGKGGGNSDDPGDELPEFDEGKCYFLTPETVNAMLKFAARDRTRVTTNTGLSVEYTADGTILSSK